MIKSFKFFSISILYLIFLSGCATTSNISDNEPKPIYPSVSNFIGSTDFIKYRRIAVLPFVDAPNAPYSGQLIQGLASQMFGKSGFEVIERARLADILNEQSLSLTGVFENTQLIQIGKILGVKAVVVGEVGQYTTRERKTETMYYPWTNYYSGQTTFLPIPGKSWSESFVSISLRVIDVETGQLVYSGSGQFNQGLANPPQQLAEAILYKIVDKWTMSPGVCGFGYNKGKIIENILKNSPAEQSGLKVGDKILKINDREVLGLSIDECKRLLWGNPGEKVILDIQRDKQNLKFEIIRDYRQNIFKNDFLDY